MAEEKSLLKNYLFNVFKTVTEILFPIVTYAYAARVLGVVGVGRVSFAFSIGAYFSMIAMLGVNYYGTREAAKLRDDPDKLRRFCMEMLIINGCTTLLACTLLACTTAAVPQLRGYWDLLLICGSGVILQGLGVEWLYQALEEYRYIALRSLFFKLGALGAMFVLVRRPGDTAAYAAVKAAVMYGACVLNFIKARRFFHFDRRCRYEIRKHIRPLLWLFSIVVSIELYTVMDTTMLGFIKGDAPVGLYTMAIKAVRTVNNLITAIGVVLIPRLSYYVGNRERGKMVDLLETANNYTFMLAVPCAFGLFALSDEVIRLFCGGGFAPAGRTMCILVPIVVLVPFSVAVNQQILIPLGEEKLMLRSTCAGAVTNLILNSLLIPRFGGNGAAAATAASEAMVAVVSFANASRFFDMGVFFKGHWQYWLASLCIPPLALLAAHLTAKLTARVALTVVCSAVCYFAALLLMRNKYVLEIVATLRMWLSLKVTKANK